MSLLGSGGDWQVCPWATGRSVSSVPQKHLRWTGLLTSGHRAYVLSDVMSVMSLP